MAVTGGCEYLLPDEQWRRCHGETFSGERMCREHREMILEANWRLARLTKKADAQRELAIAEPEDGW